MCFTCVHGKCSGTVPTFWDKLPAIQLPGNSARKSGQSLNRKLLPLLVQKLDRKFNTQKFLTIKSCSSQSASNGADLPSDIFWGPGKLEIQAYSVNSAHKANFRATLC